MENKKKQLGPSILEDWENARSFVKFLTLFYMIILKIYGYFYVTSNSFFYELISMQTNIS
jgi:hypothetical protein